jgi:hypothetical protein
MVGSTVVLIVVLGHVVSTMAQHHHAQEETTRSEALRTAGRFLERLRSDEDWAGLYARLRLHLSQQATRGLADARLADGRRTYSLSTYVAGFTAPPGMSVLVDVSSAADKASGQQVLREDAIDAQMLLPSDLDGDGVIDDVAHDTDYVYLPVRATFRWDAPGRQGPQQLSIVTWMRGER